ncbi:helix-turn-helix domain-containing protein [Nitratireductor indicus]|uniref:helix-turn-helix domain-containing protein n=1 Tax=Nitratireductor indicus TaxID=721133 RepID=UPI0028757BAB|nr:XRE family transcriptional regulator [Nitratireductor indicus]MDS1135872.1 XRE family transcriptional regulator [Nitratireductor indicus]
MENNLDHRIADRLRAMRLERNWSLDRLASESGVSRATLSRLENAEISPTAAVLGKICGSYGITLSRLLYLAEETFPALVAASDQKIWDDPETGFRRRVVSPPAQSLSGEAIEGTLPAGSRLAYDVPPRPGLEHHLIVLEGKLSMEIEGERHDLTAGDCLRYQLRGPNVFSTAEDTGARYLVFIV